MKKFFCALLLMTAVFWGGKVFAQFTNNYWCFGDSAAIDWTDPFNPIVKTSAFYYRNGSSSIADSMGLVLYSGRFNNVLPNNCKV